MAATSRNYFYEANLALKRLTILRGLRETDQVLGLFEQFIEGVSNGQQPIETVFENYHQLLGKILEHSLTTPFPSTGNPWQDYLLDRLLLCEEHFVFQLALEGVSGLAKPIIEELKTDLGALKLLFDLSSEGLKSGVETAYQGEAWQQICSHWQFSAWGNNLPNLPDRGDKNIDPVLRLKLKFYQHQNDWDQQLEVLAQHYREFGIGDFGLYHAFRFQKNGSAGCLKPIPDPDPIRLSDLVGYEKQKEQVIRNTTQFMKGFPANNLLFYGDRGTGKS
ncbi:MAG: DUF815 domain-containing protein, partial [Bacillota bacterium]